MPRSWVINSIAMPVSRFCRSRSKLQDLCLNGDVESGRRLVGDQQLGLVGKRHGDHHALTLAAGELVGIGVEAFFRIANADQVEQIQVRARVRPCRPCRDG